MFNQRSSWSYQEIADETEIPERDLMRAMQSLTMGKIGQRVLARIGEGSKVGLRGERGSRIEEEEEKRKGEKKQKK